MNFIRILYGCTVSHSGPWVAKEKARTRLALALQLSLSMGVQHFFFKPSNVQKSRGVLAERGEVENDAPSRSVERGRKRGEGGNSGRGVSVTTETPRRASWFSLSSL